MALYLIKPVVWNSNGYLRPSGDKVTSGYPAENGYGHEEWNNSEALVFEDGGRRLKAFHTEGFKNQPLDENEGAITIFMIASKGGKQFLVAVASCATSLLDDEERRRSLVEKLRINEKFRDEAWAIPKVQNLHQAGGIKRFNKKWNSEVDWIPNWICPADCYVGLEYPIELDAFALTGKGALTKMFSAFQVISRQTALNILDLIPMGNNQRAAIAGNFNDANDLQQDINDVKNGVAGETTKAALIQARRGQGKFRENTLGLWAQGCAITGCGIGELLKASHIKPWRNSSNRERLDPHNGLPLIAHLDVLFDRGLITFADDGALEVSACIDAAEIEKLGLQQGLSRPPREEMLIYLRWHRAYVFRNKTMTNLKIVGPTDSE